MKTMKKQMMTLAAVLMAGAAVTSCSSDSEMDSAKAPAAKTYTMTVSATKGGDETRALSLSGEGEKTLNATWATTENVYVKKGSDWAEGSLQPQANGTTATLKGTLTGVTIEASNEITLQFPKSGDITYAGQKGTLADIAANFDWATATATVASVEDGKITVNGNVAFVNQQAVVKFTLKNGDDALSATKLVVAVGSTEYEVNPVSATSEIYVAVPGFSNKTVTLTATVSSDTYTYEKTNVTFENGKYYRVTAKMAKQASVPENALSGQFTVGMDGSTPKKVYFSKGNLQAKIASYASNSATASEWKFADSQYSTIGNAAGNTSFVADTWVDLFSWVGNSATNDTYGLITFTSSSQANHGNVSGESLKTDWGTAAASSIGTGWRTLSSAEWTYLFNTRTNAASKFGYATVAGKVGIIIVPDDFTDPRKNNGSGAFVGSTTTGWTANVYSAENWSAMETSGCVFLPAAGDRNGTSVNNVGSYGNYWSRAANGTDYAYDVYFDSGNVSPADDSNRDDGFSVRLVRPVE